MERSRALTQSSHEGFSELSLEQSRAEALRGAWRGEGSPAACRLSEQGRALRMAGRVGETGVTGLTGDWTHELGRSGEMVFSVRAVCAAGPCYGDCVWKGSISGTERERGGSGH